MGIYNLVKGEIPVIISVPHNGTIHLNTLYMRNKENIVTKKSVLGIDQILEYLNKE